MKVFFYSCLIFTGSFLFQGCNNDNPEPEDPNIKVVGNTIYRIVEGSNLSGSRGQILNGQIVLEMTDLQGNPLFKNLRYELSDEDSEIFVNSSFDDGQVRIDWKLGCNDLTQSISVIDNVCGIAKDGCIDVTIFEINSSANEPISNGWFQSCQNYSFLDVYDDNFLSDDERFIVVTDFGIYSTEELIRGSMSFINLNQNYGNTEVRMGDNGDIYYMSYTELYLNKKGTTSWDEIDLPSNAYSVNQVAIMENGNIVFADDFSSTLFLSTNNGNSFQEILNVFNETDGLAYNIQSVVTSGNKLFIVTQNNNVLEWENGVVKRYQFAANSWDSWGNIYDFESEFSNNKIFLNENNRELYVLNLDTETVVGAANFSYNSNLVKSGEDIYITYNNTTEYQKFTGTYFEPFDVELPSGDFGYTNINVARMSFFKSSPVVFTNRGDLYYFVN
ncbi:MAG: hypothetical protein AAF363_09240 [Bacteroidota bacterium]